MADQEYNKNKVDQEKAAQGQIPNTPIQGIPASSVQAQPKQRTAQDIIDNIFSYQPPKPVYDPKRPEEIKRQMKVNALTEGLKTLGDAFALSRGANVNRREPDTQNSQLLGSLHNYIDNYNKNLDTWNYNNYMNRVKKGLTELQQYNTEQQAKANQTKMAYDMAKDQRDYGLKKDQLTEAKEWREGDTGRQKEIAKYQSELRMNENDKKYQQDLAKYEAKVQANNKGFMLYDDRGNAVKQLGAGELEKIFNIIIHDPVTEQSANSDYTFMKAQFGEGLTTQMMKTIIGGHWQDSPDFLQYIGIKPQQKKSDNSVFGNINPRPPYTGPATQVTQDTTKPKRVPTLFQ